jgi:hypothetical protein
MEIKNFTKLFMILTLLFLEPQKNKIIIQSIRETSPKPFKFRRNATQRSKRQTEFFSKNFKIKLTEKIHIIKESHTAQRNCCSTLQ